MKCDDKLKIGQNSIENTDAINYNVADGRRKQIEDINHLFFCSKIAPGSDSALVDGNSTDILLGLSLLCWFKSRISVYT